VTNSLVKIEEKTVSLSLLDRRPGVKASPGIGVA
jgi:hypothetical protein